MVLPQIFSPEDLFERLALCLTAVLAPDDSEAELEVQAAELEAFTQRGRVALGDEALWCQLAREALELTEAQRNEILRETAQTMRMLPAFERTVQQVEAHANDARIPASSRARLRKVAAIFREAQGLSRAILELILAVNRAFDGLPLATVRRGHWLRYQAAKARAFEQDPTASSSGLWADLDALEAARSAEDILAAAASLRDEQARLGAHLARGGTAEDYDPSQA